MEQQAQPNPSDPYNLLTLTTPHQPWLLEQKRKLLDLMSDGADVELAFDDDSTMLPAHSQLLRLCSGVLAKALEASAAVVDGRVDGRAMRIPLPGTSRADWLTAMRFVYPAFAPLPVVTWDNLELLLTLGGKYDMPLLLDCANAFLRDNAGQLGKGISRQDAWTWLSLADKHGLAAVKDLINAHATRRDVLQQCKEEVLLGLSHGTTAKLLLAEIQRHLK